MFDAQNEPSHWPTCPEEFTRVMPQPFEGTSIGAWTPPTPPLARTNKLRRCRTIYHSLPSTPYTLRDYTTSTTPILPTPQLNSRDLYRGVKEATSKGSRHFGPPLGGYEHNKLDYNLKHKSAGPIKIGDKRGPNSDLGGGKPYKKEVKDSTGDVIMQESIWTTAEKTSFLVSISHSPRETSAYELQEQRCTTVLISSNMDAIPSLVITAPEQGISPKEVTNSNAPRPVRNNEYDKDIPVYSNGVWAPTNIRKRKDTQ